MGLFSSSFISGYIPDLTSPRYTQDYFPIKAIEEGVIVTKDNRYLKIIEIKPINFMMKSEKEMDDILEDFERWLFVCPYNVQIKIIAQNSDASGVINLYKERMKKSKDTDVERFVNHEINLLRALTNSDTVSMHFYMIISYEPKANKKALDKTYEIVRELNAEVKKISDRLSECDNSVVPLSGTLDNLSNESVAVGEFLYKLFNPRTSSFSGTEHPVSFGERCARVYSDSKIANEDASFKPDNAYLIAPMGIDTHESDCIIMDGKYFTSMFIKGTGYPVSAYAGWFNRLISLLKTGDMIDIFFHKENSEKMRKYASQKIKSGRIDTNTADETDLNYEQIGRKLSSARYIKSAISNDEKVFYVSTIVTLSDLRYNSLREKKELFIDKLDGIIDFDECINLQEEVFRCTFPFLSLTPKVYSRSRRNIMSSGLSSMYPFISFEKIDSGGVLIGLNLLNGSICVLNPWERPTYKNANIFIAGTTGAGKSYFLMNLALRLRAAGKQCFIIAPDKAHEFSRACNQFNGSFIKISGSSNNHINIMDIRPKATETSEILDGEQAENTIYLSEKVQDIITFIQLIMPDVTVEEQQLIDIACVSTYKDYGITTDNNSIFNKDGSLKTMPILGDLREKLIENNRNGRLDRVINGITQYTHGSMKSFNARTNVDLDNKYIVFDVASLNDENMPAGMFIALNFITSRIKEDRLEDKMVFIDEGWKLIGKDSHPKAAKYVEGIFRTIRAYNGGACLATQQVADAFASGGENHTAGILTHADTKVLLNLDQSELKLLTDSVSLTEQELKSIPKYKTGNCLIIANNHHIPARTYASNYADKLVTTDPNKLKQVLKEMEENGGTIL